LKGRSPDTPGSQEREDASGLLPVPMLPLHGQMRNFDAEGTFIIIPVIIIPVIDLPRPSFANSGFPMNSRAACSLGQAASWTEEGACTSTSPPMANRFEIELSLRAR
jgi:hypothetical protein